MRLEEPGKVLKIAKSSISFETPIDGEEKPHPGDFIEGKNTNGEIDANMVAIAETSSNADPARSIRRASETAIGAHWRASRGKDKGTGDNASCDRRAAKVINLMEP